MELNRITIIKINVIKYKQLSKEAYKGRVSTAPLIVGHNITWKGSVISICSSEEKRPTIPVS
jgi:hypothetical protein